jgi:hypothetical protein
MSKIERIGDRLPRFYKNWQKNSLIFSLLQAVGKQMDRAEEEISNLMKAHWVSTAQRDELGSLGVLVGSKRIPEEDDMRYRARLKRAVNEYKGGGTVSAIFENIKELMEAKSDEDIEIVENPPVKDAAEFLVIANDTWTLGSNSIEDEEPSLTLTVEGEGEVSNPEIINTDTAESITLNGKLKSGERLTIKKNKAFIDEQDVTENISTQKPPILLRKGSTWKYSEALLERIGVFDTAKFDEHTFAVGVPTVKIRFEWTRRQPATFLVQIRSKALRESGLTESYLEKAVNSMKAAGVNAIIKVRG